MKTIRKAAKPGTKKKTAHKTGKRPTFGLLSDVLTGSGAIGLWVGLDEAARERGVNLICFSGNALHDIRGDMAQANVLYDLANAECLDGLLIYGGIAYDSEEIKPLCERYRPLPVVNISSLVEGIPTVMGGDNYQGMHEAMVHLLQVHGYRRIAFIKGIELNAEAQERFRAYAEALAEHGLPLDPDLVAPGNFLRPSGAEAIHLLLDERKVNFDAIVGANDYAALGALEALQERGIRVPGDVAVIGFDDVEEARYSTPPLTTLRQRFYEMGRQALEMVLSLLAGQSAPGQVTLPLEMVVRQSCGCLAQEVEQAVAGQLEAMKETFSAVLTAQQEQILVEMTQAVASSLVSIDPAWMEELLEAYAYELGGTSRGAFLSAFDGLLRRVASASGDVNVWQGAVSVLRRYSLPALGDGVMRVRSEDLWHQARVLIGDIAQRAQAYRRFQREQQVVTLSEVSQDLITAFDMEELMDVLARELPRLGIPSCYLSLYEDPQKPTEWSRLVLAYDEMGRVDPGVAGRRFRSTQLVPSELLRKERQSSLLVEALYFQKEQIGFVVFEPGPRDGLVYNLLRREISSALKGALLVQQVESHTRELKQAYDTLQKQQQVLLVTEKMASLGRLTAGIAHEMNTPLAAVRSALHTLDELIQEYQSSIGDVEVSEADCREIAQEMKQTVELSKKAAERAASFIRSIKSQTRDLAPQESVSYNAVLVISEALLLLSHTLKEGRCEAIFEPSSDEVELHGSPGRLAQVVTNLVNNAIEASIPKGGGPITLRLAARPKEIELQVSDLGCGIAPQILPKIYDPMFTTKPFGQSTGLGLTIVHDIVTDEYGGTIEVSTQVGQGTTFTLHFPNRREV